MEKSKVTRGLSQRRGTIHVLKQKQDSLKNKKSSGVSFADQKKVSTSTTSFVVGARNEAYDSDYDEQMTNFSGSFRGSIGQERNSSHFIQIDDQGDERSSTL